MKTTTLILTLIFCFSISLYPAKRKKENNLLGLWKLVKAETNGRPNPSYAMDRSFEYTGDGLFEGKIFINGEERPFNSGKFFLPNDSTMICIHFTPDNKLSRVSYTYNFHVNNDSLHLYGVYFNVVQDKPNLLQMNYINERWVKVKPTEKK
jgi:hypothetical protein